MTKELSQEQKNLIKDAFVHVFENTDSIDIATTDENLTVDEMFQQASLPSLARLIFSVVPMNGPTAALFNIEHKPDGSGIKLLRNEVQVYDSEPVKSGLTRETVEDLRNQYGKEADKVIGILLRSLANEQENQKALEFLEANSEDAGALTLTDAQNAETVLFELVRKVKEQVLKANSVSHRTYGAYCVLPYTFASSISALSEYIGGDDKTSDLYFSYHNGVKFYLNPDVSITNTVYVGLKSENNMSKSAAVFSPYQSTVSEATDPKTGETVYHLFNRFAITASPLNENRKLMYKFNIS